MSYDITLSGSLIGAGFEVATAVGEALTQSTESYPGRLIRVHGIDGETVLAEVRNGELVSLMPGILVSSAFDSEQQGEVIEPTADHLALVAHLPEDMRAKVSCIRWLATWRDAETVLWTSLANLRVEGYIEPVAV